MASPIACAPSGQRSIARQPETASRIPAAGAAGRHNFSQPQHATRGFLMPGEWFFGRGQGTMSTLLGSCVSAVLWHPQQRLAGFCHILLSSRGALPPSIDQYDGRYCEEIIPLFLRQMTRYNVRPQEFQAHLLGGGDMFPNRGVVRGTIKIGDQNAATMKSHLVRLGIRIVKEDTGNSLYRKVSIDLATGNVTFTASPVAQGPGAVRR
jgi:chemotaxis protein CheD